MDFTTTRAFILIIIVLVTMLGIFANVSYSAQVHLFPILSMGGIWMGSPSTKIHEIIGWNEVHESKKAGWSGLGKLVKAKKLAK